MFPARFPEEFLPSVHGRYKKEFAGYYTDQAFLGPLNPKQREIIKEIMASNKYMQNMAENVLTNYKTENGKLKIQKTKNDIKTTIENTVENLKFIISQKNQSIKVSYKNIDNTTAYYDDIEIKRVLSNLIVNASEYSFDNSTIDILVEKENNHLHKIIDKFYETVEKFIDWICHKFGIGESKELVRNFEKETHTFIDPVKQLKREEREKEWDLEI